MKLDLIKDKLDELKYKIDLEHIGLQKAKYNIDNAEKLGLTQNSINKYISKMAYYSSKIDINEKALEAYSNCYKDSQNLVDGDYYFKCTLPYEQVDDLSSYQTQITIDEKAVKLFANGINYKDAISFLDNSDIKYIQSTYKTKPTVDELKSKDVFIEVCDKSEIKELLDEPVLAKTSDSKTYKGLIASSQIPVCYGFEGNSYKDLNGDKYYPNSPSYETIKNMNDTVAEKQSKFENLYAIEYKVKTKLENTVSNFDKAILDKNSKMENVLKNIKVM